MPRETKDQKINRLQEMLDGFRKYIEQVDKRNAELLQAEKGTFLHSPTYLQMKEELDFVKNLNKLNEIHIASIKGQLHKADDNYRQVFIDNKALTSEKADREYFVGITENWRTAREYQKLKQEVFDLQGKVEQQELSIADRDNEIHRLQMLLAEKTIEKQRLEQSVVENHTLKERKSVLGKLQEAKENVVTRLDEPDMHNDNEIKREHMNLLKEREAF